LIFCSISRTDKKQLIFLNINALPLVTTRDNLDKGSPGDSPDEFHKSETRLVVKFLSRFFLCFYFCSVDLNITECVLIMLLYCH